MSSEHIISSYRYLLCKTDASVIFFLNVYKVKRNFLYEVFILRLWRSDNLNCVLFLSVFIEVLGTCLVLNCAVSFVKQCSSVCTWLTKQHSKIAWQNTEKCLISCWYYVPRVGTILNFQNCFVIVQSLISYFTVLIHHVLYAWSEQHKNVFIFHWTET